MSTALKCPNPSCPYLFDPSRVPAGVVLTCPRCGIAVHPRASGSRNTSPPAARSPASQACDRCRVQKGCRRSIPSRTTRGPSATAIAFRRR